MNAVSPIFHDGYLFFTSGYHTGAALYKLAAEGDKLSATEVWRSDVLLNKFGRCWSTPVLFNGRLYARNLDRLVCFNLRPQG